jgi:hypothetical protein
MGQEYSITPRLIFLPKILNQGVVKVTKHQYGTFIAYTTNWEELMLPDAVIVQPRDGWPGKMPTPSYAD